MRIVLGLVLVALVVVAVRWLVAARRQRALMAPDEADVMGPHLSLRPSVQVFRALRAARPTQVRDPQRPPEPGTGPMLHP